MEVTKGLIIAEPWIGLILDGSKTWEMRSTAASHRGWFGLIQKGSGTVVGVARLVDVGAPLSLSGMLETIGHHRIPEEMVRSGEVAAWNTPWKLADARPLSSPVPYEHQSGAVTWVNLNPSARAGIARQLLAIEGLSDDDVIQAPPPTLKAQAPGAPKTTAAPDVIRTASPRAGGRIIGEVRINDANIRNNHIYLRELIDRFPSDAIGGSNRASSARRTLLIEWGGPEPVRTDIDGSKRFFRARGWIGEFFRANRARASDVVVVEELAPYRYRVRIKAR